MTLSAGSSASKQICCANEMPAAITSILLAPHLPNQHQVQTGSSRMKRLHTLVVPALQSLSVTTEAFGQDFFSRAW